MLKLLEFWNKLWIEIIAGIVVAIIIALAMKFYREYPQKSVIAAISSFILFLLLLVKKFSFYLPAKKKAEKQLNELKKSKREHPVSRYLMNFIAKQSGINLFSHYGEYVSLREYAEILHRSIDSNHKILKEVYSIELTLPSQWYHKDPEDPKRGETIEVIRKYFNQQKNLKIEKKDAVTIKRYIVTSRADFDADPQKDRFIEEHNINRTTNQKIELYLCPTETLTEDTNNKVKDSTIFIDEKQKGWVVEGLDFNSESVENPSKWIRVRIVDDQEQIKNFYYDLINELNQNAKSLI